MATRKSDQNKSLLLFSKWSHTVFSLPSSVTIAGARRAEKICICFLGRHFVSNLFCTEYADRLREGKATASLYPGRGSNSSWAFNRGPFKKDWSWFGKNDKFEPLKAQGDQAIILIKCRPNHYDFIQIIVFILCFILLLFYYIELF